MKELNNWGERRGLTVMVLIKSKLCSMSGYLYRKPLVFTWCSIFPVQFWFSSALYCEGFQSYVLHYIVPLQSGNSAFVHFYRRIGAGYADPLRMCSIITKQVKIKLTSFLSLRKAAIDHQKYVKSATMYPLEHSPRHGMLCTVWTT